MAKLKIGVFGGGRGYTMIEQLIHHPDAEVVAICDKYEPLLEALRKWVDDELHLNVALYTSFDEFIKHDMDAVVLANYATEHAIYAVKCLKAGKHVMSEVLPAETPAQMVELIETVEQTGLVYAYAENYCYMTAPLEMQRRYRNGDIGEVMYAEGEYIHDCSSIRPEITYGERNHWRNKTHCNFYCTHSFGPIVTITGLRPVSVVGFETNINDDEKLHRIGCHSRAGIEMVTLENGAVVKSVHGHLKREPGSINYQVYGSVGMMESKRYNDEEFNIYKEGPKLCQGEWEKYMPDSEIGRELRDPNSGHGGSDFYPTHCFIQKILGKPDGQYSIDVYTASDMGMVGLMAYRSVLDNNNSKEVPNFRIPAVRDRYRFDNACTSPAVAGDQLLPVSSKKLFDVSDETYAEVRKRFLGEPSAIDDLL